MIIASVVKVSAQDLTWYSYSGTKMATCGKQHFRLHIKKENMLILIQIPLKVFFLKSSWCCWIIGFGNGFVLNRQWTTTQTNGEEFHWCQNMPLGWYWVKYGIPPGAHFTNDFSILIRIQCEFIVLTQMWIQWSLTNFAYDKLLCYVQKYRFLGWNHRKTKFSWNYNYRQKVVNETDPSIDQGIHF